MASPRRPRRGPAAVSRVWTAIEFVLGVALLGAAALAGVLIAKRPGPNRVDAAGYFYVPSDPGSHLANELVKIGSLPALLVGIAVIFALTIFRDWVRALACAAAPIVAVEVVEHIAKPMVGREIGAGSFTYPSGTVAAVAALAAAVFLVSPRLLRPLSALAGALVVASVGWAVLVLRWHYPTDVLGGVWVGSGAVFFIDALAHLPWLVIARQPPFDNHFRAPAASPRICEASFPRYWPPGSEPESSLPSGSPMAAVMSVRPACRHHEQALRADRARRPPSPPTSARGHGRASHLPSSWPWRWPGNLLPWIRGVLRR